MSRDPQLKNERNRLIKAAYAKLRSETVPVFGKKDLRVEKYTHKAMCAMVGRKFFLAPDTIERIVNSPEEEENTNQLNLFE